MKTLQEQFEAVRLTTVRARDQFLRFLMGFGLLVAALASLPPDVLDTFNLPGLVKYKPYLIAGGLLAGTVKQWVLALGDWLDDWKINNSFSISSGKLGLWLVLALLLSVLLPSCAQLSTMSPQITADGCVAVPYKDAKGNAYTLKACLGGRYMAEWRNSVNFQIRAVWTRSTNKVSYFYKSADMKDADPWIMWGAKSAVSLDPPAVPGLPSEIKPSAAETLAVNPSK